MGLFIPHYGAAATQGAAAAFNDLGVAGAAWSWFSSPLASTIGNYTFTGGTDSAGNITVSRYSHLDGSSSSFICASFEADDHNAPVIVQLPNGKMACFYTRHNADTTLRFRISASTDGIDFGAEQTLTASLGNVTYSQAHVLSNGKIVWLYRTMNGSTHRWALRTSTDNAASWSAEQELFNFTIQGYIRTALDPSDNIQVALSHHPDVSGTTDRSVYHCIITAAGAVTASDGTVLGNLDGTSLPVAIGSCTKVYDHSVSGEKAWVWDIAKPDGHLALAFATLPSQTLHRYKYAVYDAGAWTVRQLVADAGGSLSDSREPSYSAGLTLGKDTGQDGVVWLGRSAENRWRIEKWTTTDLGVSWTSQLISDGAGWQQARPVAVLNGADAVPVVWMTGRYRYYLGEYDSDAISQHSQLRPNNAVALNGTNQYMTVPLATPFGSALTKYTIEAWVRTSNTADILAVCGAFNDGSTTGLQILLNADSSESLLAGGIHFFVRDSSVTSKRLIAGVNSNTGITDGNWHHLAVAWDTTTNTVNIYLDEVAQATTYAFQETPDTFEDWAYPFAFGARNVRGTFDRHLPGDIDEIRAWNGVRNASSIADKWNAHLDGWNTGLVGYWPLNEGEGMTAEDYSANENSGTLANGPTWIAAAPY